MREKRYTVYVALVVVALGIRVAADFVTPSAASPKLYRVRGFVSYDGRPAKGVFVTTYADEQPYLGLAVSNDRGEFFLYTELKPSAVAGKHYTSVAMFSAEDLSDTKSDRFSMKAARAESDGRVTGMQYADPSRNLLPQRYLMIYENGLDFVVEEHHENEVTFTLEG